MISNRKDSTPETSVGSCSPLTGGSPFTSPKQTSTSSEFLRSILYLSSNQPNAFDIFDDDDLEDRTSLLKAKSLEEVPNQVSEVQEIVSLYSGIVKSRKLTRFNEFHSNMKRTMASYRDLLDVINGKARSFVPAISIQSKHLIHTQSMFKSCKNTLAFPASGTVFYYRSLSDHIYDKPEHLASITSSKATKFFFEALPENKLKEIYSKSGGTALSIVFNAFTLDNLLKIFIESQTEEKVTVVPQSEAIYSIKKHVIGILRILSFDLELHCENLAFIIATIQIYNNICKFMVDILKVTLADIGFNLLPRATKSFLKFALDHFEHECITVEEFQQDFCNNFITEVVQY